MLSTGGIFHRKENQFDLSGCRIDKVVTLPKDEYIHFKNNMLTNFDFIADSIEDMYVDSNKTIHCLLVMGEESPDGVLIDSSGYGYARYTSYLPNAKLFMESQIQKLSDLIIENHENIIDFTDIENRYNVKVTPNNGIGSMLLNELQRQNVISDIDVQEDCFNVTYTIANNGLTVRDLLKIDLEDIHLCHADEEHDVATIVELSKNTLTDFGKSEWADVLNATVKRLYNGYYGTQLDVEGVNPQRLADFSNMLAGNCSEEYYNNCVAEEIEPPQVDMKM